ncbi:hypothetical protein M9Y10_033664 [Tritrichomonas musculus]|uniref:Protein kinase domain-containing protein n=1 Tax=Tritrichomonas musculus TaxID=1915356 RepID=A0ABR2KCR7_9EUKA
MDFEGVFFDTKDYKLHDKDIGKGAFGTVYIAENLQDNSLCAAKIIHTNNSFDGNDQKLFLRESLTLYQLDHPSIIKFIGVNFQSFHDSGRLEPAIITEYLPNGSLKKTLEMERKKDANANWNPTKKYITLIGIADAMRYLHDNGIVHRDLKPDNILIDSDYYPRVCDFGLSRCFPEQLTKSKQLTMTGNIGTPLYMSPELLGDEEIFNPAAVDVYAFGILAYEIVTGEVPFHEIKNMTPFVLAKKVQKGVRPKFKKGVNKKMKNLIEQCWNNNVEARPSFEEIFQQLSTDYSFATGKIKENEVTNYVQKLLKARGESKSVHSSFASSNTQIQLRLSQAQDEKNDMVQKYKQLEEEKEALEEKVNKLKNKNAKLQSQLDNYASSSGDLILGLDAILGNEKERNNALAATYFRQSSDKGNSYASYLLGLLYENGEGVTKSFKNASSYYQKSADQGNSNGLNRIGFCYKNGYGVEKNYTKAIEFYQKSKDLGNPFAYNNLGFLYRNGIGVAQDSEKALDYYKKAAELGDSSASYNLGCLYEKGNGVKQNYSTAIRHYEKAAEQGNAFAYNNLAFLYQNGKGVDQDYSKAIDYYEKAAELGDPAAYFNLGSLYRNGMGVKQSFTKAFEYFKKASELGHAPALLNLGFLYESGKGIKLDYHKALECYQKSADLGNADAQKRYNSLKKKKNL